MKRIFCLLIALAALLSLCACEVNWFTKTVDVPWYTIAIPMAIIAVAGFFILMGTTFVCPKCGAEFQPKWYQFFMVAVHFNRKRLNKCPKCGHKGFFAKKRNDRFS